MNQRKFEIVIAVLFAIICYLGNYYLKENAIKEVVFQSIAWHILNILWLLSMVVIGYWGLYNHEIKWVKIVWLLVNFIILAVLFINKVVETRWHHVFIPTFTSTVVRTPFFFLAAAYLPRWISGYSISKNE